VEIIYRLDGISLAFRWIFILAPYLVICGYFRCVWYSGDVQIFWISSVSFRSTCQTWPSTIRVWIIQQGVHFIIWNFIYHLRWRLKLLCDHFTRLHYGFCPTVCLSCLSVSLWVFNLKAKRHSTIIFKKWYDLLPQRKKPVCQLYTLWF